MGLIGYLHRRPPAIAQYAALLAGLILMLLTVFALLTSAELEQVKRDLAASSRLAAHNELEEALARIVADIADNTREFAAWEEAYQQFAIPHFYGYWRNHRMHHADVLGDFAVDAEVYGADKQVLLISEQATLPRSLADSPMEPYVECNSAGVPTLIEFAVVRDKTDPAKILGYVATRSGFLRTLKTQSSFHFLDAATLRLSEPGSGRVAVTDLEELFEFELRPNPMTETMRTAVGNAVVRLGVLVGGVLLIMLPLLLHLLGRPLLRVTQHIERLKQSPGGLMLERVSGRGLPVAEMEKIRGSLNEYQARLLDVHSSLDQKNRELWDMAHHDALTGTKNRRAFDKYWREVQSLLVEQRF